MKAIIAFEDLHRFMSILQKEEPDICSPGSDPQAEGIKNLMIRDWRMKKMKLLMKDVVKFEGKDGTTYFRSPVLSIDYDLSYLNAIIDAFLCNLFSNYKP